MNSQYFRGELTFIPRYNSDDPLDCTKRVISFRDIRASEHTVGELYEEWMIGCKTERYYASFQAEYFISRGYNSEDEVFVYRWEDPENSSRIVMEYLFGNVRFKV